MRGRVFLQSFFIFSLLFSLTAGSMAFALKKSDSKIENLQIRAKRIFVYDNENPKKLPAHLVRSLSMAIVFHDYTGARTLIGRLEPELSH